MKLQRTPLVLLILAALLGGIVFLNEQTTTQKENTAEQAQSIFSFKEADVQTVMLKTANQNLAFTKIASTKSSTSSPTPSPNPSSSQTPASEPQIWQMTAPKNSPANDASIAFLLNLLSTAKREKSLTAPAAKQRDFGLDAPLATIEVTLQDQQKHRLVLGKPDFNRSALYALIDPPNPPSADITVALVPTDFENAVNRPLSEWQNSPPKTLSKPNQKSEKKPKVQSK